MADDPSLAELYRLAVPRDDIPHAIREAAFEALLAVGTHLKLSPFPTVQFLSRSTGRRLAVRGLVCPDAVDTLWIVVQESAADVTETVAHEALHAQQIGGRR